MSMSMHVYAVNPADDDYRLKVEAWRACRAAGIVIPPDLARFFNDEDPDPTGVVEHLSHNYSKDPHPSVAKYNADMQEGFEVDISKLPEGTRFVRFVCSW